MNHIISLFVVLITLTAKAQQCSRGQTYLVLGFDDLQVAPYDTPALPWPYDDFIFSRGPSGYSDPHIPVTNITGMDGWLTSASSQPNVIFTTAESLIMKQVATKNQRTFVLQGVSLTSIYIDQMSIFIDMSRNGTLVNRMNTTLPIGIRRDITIDTSNNIDQVTIGCTVYSYSTCAHMAYDDFRVCYKHS